MYCCKITLLLNYFVLKFHINLHSVDRPNPTLHLCDNRTILLFENVYFVSQGLPEYGCTLLLLLLPILLLAQHIDPDEQKDPESVGKEETANKVLAPIDDLVSSMKRLSLRPFVRSMILPETSGKDDLLRFLDPKEAFKEITEMMTALRYVIFDQFFSFFALIAVSSRYVTRHGSLPGCSGSGLPLEIACVFSRACFDFFGSIPRFFVSDEAPSRGPSIEVSFIEII